MQPVNVLPAFVSQDADLKVKESSGSSADNNQNTDFSSLIEQHFPEKSTSNSRRKSISLEQNVTAKLGQSVAGNVKSNVDEVNISQESAANESLDASNPNIEGSSTDEILIKENNVDVKTSTSKGSLTESEQFIALLYNSDQTLIPVGDKTKASKEVATTNSKQVNDVDISDVDVPIKRKSGEVIVTVVSPTQNNPVLVGEHKLKAFSKDELLASTQLSSNNVLGVQSSSQSLKDYQLSLQSQQGVIKSANIPSEQLTNDQLVNAQLTKTQPNNKIAEITTDVSLASKNQVIAKVNSDLYQLPVESDSEPSGEESSIAKNIPFSSKESVIKSELNQGGANVNSLVKPQGEIDVELATKEIDDIVTSPTKVINRGQEVVNINPNKSDAVKPQLSTANVDKEVAERSPKVMVENILKEQAAVAQEKQPVLAQDNKPVMTNPQLQALQQVQAQQKVSPETSEQQVIEGADDEYIDQMLPSEEVPTAQTMKTSSKVIDTIAMRSVSELQAQTVQATQTKQSNDAYLDHQVSEVLNHNVVSDTAQIQKNNIQLQHEIISIFRKDFAEAVKDKVLMTINQKLQQFDITLDPPEFGNMQVRVNLQGEQASVNFIVQNQQAKDALEQNMHKLRDMLSEQGVDVGDANVEQQNQQQNNDEQNLQQNNDSSAVLINGTEKDGHNVEHTLSTTLFDSSATSVDYYV